MSYSLDANLLLYASDASSEQHASASAFLESRADDPDVFCLTWLTLMSYQRIATHPSIFSEPLSPKDAWENVRGLTGMPRVMIIGEDENFASDYAQTVAR